MFDFLKIAKLFPKWPYHFVPSPAVNESSGSSASLPIFGIVDLFDSSHSKRNVMAYHCEVNLHLPKDVEYHCRPCIFFWMTCLLRSFAYFLIGLFVFLLLNFESSLYVPDTGLLSDIYLANIFF